MAVRGVYTKAEEEMVAVENKKMDMMVGWAKFPDRVATEESIKSIAIEADPWNPLWRDEDYAAATRWGGIIAIPTYQDRFRSQLLPEIGAAPEYGYQDMIWIGEDWEFFKPIHVNDSFRAWDRRPQLKDVTPLDGKGPRTFARLTHDRDHINQKDELVSTTKFYDQRRFLPDGPPKPYSMPEYGHTKEEVEFIVRTIGEEEIRGADVRYWEDVNVGEDTRPVVLGPTNVQTVVSMYGRMGTITREAFLKDPMGTFLQDPDTGFLYTHAGRHFSDRAAQAGGDGRAFLAAISSKFSMIRLLTNWMGDDGFLRKFNWRHIMRIAIGDTVIGHGKVTNKRVEDGEYLVDLAVWGRNLRGNVTEAATATVSLSSREAPLKWK